MVFFFEGIFGHSSVNGLSINLTGIAAGKPGQNQTLTVTAASINPALIPTPTVTDASSNVTRTLSLARPANAGGGATITVADTNSNAFKHRFYRAFLAL